METLIYIVHSTQVDDYTEYTIQVHHGGYIWKVNHRYSEFKAMHDAIRLKHPQVEKSLLPPKKIFGKMSPMFVDKRRGELEAYLQTLLNMKFKHGLPLPLRKFLHFNLYDVEMICQTLSEKLYRIGDNILNSGSSYTFNTLELWAITERISMQKPSTDIENPSYDFGHLLDFVYNLKYLHVLCHRGDVGTSNIKAEELVFDIAIFRSLSQLVSDGLSSDQAQSLVKLHRSLTSLSVHNSLTTIQSIVTGGYHELDSSVEWKNLVTADFSDNIIERIDHSVKQLVCVEFLDLSRNKISKIENLHHLASLTFIDLSFNMITEFECAHAKMGNVKTLILASNKLSSLHGLEKLYSLETLNVSNNLISELNEIDYVSRLPCILRLNLSQNTVTTEVDYRTKTLSKFGGRASEICLDETVSTQRELDTAAVLHAIFKSHRSSTSASTPTGSYTAGKSSPVQIQRRKFDDSPVFSAPGRFYETPEVITAYKRQIGSTTGSFSEGQSGNQSRKFSTGKKDKKESIFKAGKADDFVDNSSLPSNSQDLPTSHTDSSEIRYLYSETLKEEESKLTAHDRSSYASQSKSPCDTSADVTSNKAYVNKTSNKADVTESTESSAPVNDSQQLLIENAALSLTSQILSERSSAEDADNPASSCNETDHRTTDTDDTMTASSSPNSNCSLNLSIDAEVDSHVVNREDATNSLPIPDDSVSQLVSVGDDVTPSHSEVSDAKSKDETDAEFSADALTIFELQKECRDSSVDLNFELSVGPVDDPDNIEVCSSLPIRDDVAEGTTSISIQKSCGDESAKSSPTISLEDNSAASDFASLVETEKVSCNVETLDCAPGSNKDESVLIESTETVKSVSSLPPSSVEAGESLPTVQSCTAVVGSDELNDVADLTSEAEDFFPKLEFVKEPTLEVTEGEVFEKRANDCDQNAPRNESLQSPSDVTDQRDIIGRESLNLPVGENETRAASEISNEDCFRDVEIERVNAHRQLSNSCESIASPDTDPEEVAKQFRSHSLGTETSSSDIALCDTLEGKKKTQKREEDFAEIPDAEVCYQIDNNVGFKANYELRVEPVMNMKFSSLALRYLSNSLRPDLAAIKFEFVKTDEKILYVTWSPVVLYEQPNEELICAIFLSNKSLYLVPDSSTNIKSPFTLPDFENFLTVDGTAAIRFPFTEIVHIVVGLFSQYIRVTGSAPSRTASLLTRSPYLSNNLVKNLLEAMEEDDANVSELLEKAEKLEDVSISLRNGIAVTIENERAMMEFNLTTLESQKYNESHDRFSRFLYFLVHLQPEEHEASSKTLLLTSEFCCLCDENVVSYPIPEFEIKAPNRQRFCNLQLFALADIIRIELEDLAGLDVTIRGATAAWTLLFRDCTERNKLIRALCEQRELSRENSLQIHCVN